MVDASELKAEFEIYAEHGKNKEKQIIERAISSEKIPNIPNLNLVTSTNFASPITRIRKGAKLHVPSDYHAIIYTEESKGICRFHGVLGYSEPENPHKIDELPELPLKGFIRKSYEARVLYIKTDREDFGIRFAENEVYITRNSGWSPILTTDLMPVYYNVFRLETQIIDPNTFLTRLISKRVQPVYERVKTWVLQELHWIVNGEVSKFDLLSAIKKKLTIQKTIEAEFQTRLQDIGLDLLGFVWDYDIEKSIRDRYFWLHVQKIPSKEVLRMETLLNMSKELSKSPSTAGSGAQTVIGMPFQSKESEQKEE